MPQWCEKFGRRAEEAGATSVTSLGWKLNSFFKFVIRGNVIGLAVGVVIGAAFTALVGSFVAAFLAPIVEVVTRIGGKYGDAKFYVGTTPFPYGLFINGLISFVMVASVVYFFVVMPVNKITEELNPHHDLGKAKRACPDCLSQIPARARRCSNCTSHVEPIQDDDSEALIEETPGRIALIGGPSFGLKSEGEAGGAKAEGEAAKAE